MTIIPLSQYQKCTVAMLDKGIEENQPTSVRLTEDEVGELIEDIFEKEAFEQFRLLNIPRAKERLLASLLFVMSKKEVETNVLTVDDVSDFDAKEAIIGQFKRYLRKGLPYKQTTLTIKGEQPWKNTE